MFAVKFLEETGPNTELGWLLYVFLGFFLLMVLVGWLTSRRNGGPVEAAHDRHVHHEGESTVHAPQTHAHAEQAVVSQEVHVSHEEPVVHAQPAATDDLVRLEGIGPRVAKVLNDAGITTFAALAAANPVEVQKTLSAAGLQMMNPQGWIEQAALAAKGDWVALEKMQSELKGGRHK